MSEVTVEGKFFLRNPIIWVMFPAPDIYGCDAMTKTTEWLLRAALLLVIVYVGWQLAVQTVVTQINLSARVQQAEVRCPAK